MQAPSYYIEGLFRQPSAAAARTYLGIASANLTSVADVDVTFTNNTTGNASVVEHGFMPRLSGIAAEFFNGQGAWALVKDSDLSLSNITANDVSIAAHGFAPKLPNDATKFLNGVGGYTVPAGGGVGTVTHTGNLDNSHLILGNAVADIRAKADLGTTTTLLHGNAAGDPTFATVVEADITLANNVTNDVSIARHGFAPTLPNDATKFLNGVGGYTVPPGSGGSGTVTNTGTLTDHGVIVGNGGVDVSALSVGTTNTVLHGNTGADPSFSAVVEADITLANNTTNDMDSTRHGFAPKGTGSTSQYLDGNGNFSTPTGTDYFWDQFEVSLMPTDGATSDPYNCLRTESGTITQIAPTGSTPCLQDYATTASVNNVVSVGTTSVSQFPYFQELRYEALYAIQVNTAVRGFVGLTNNSIATQGGADLPAGKYAMFRFSTGSGDANWMCCTNNNSSSEAISSGVAFVAGTVYRFKITWDGTTTGKVNFFINGSLVHSSAMDLGSTDLLGFRAQLTTLANTIKNCRCGGQKLRVNYF